MKQIIIDVSETGEIKIETHGFTGSDCLKESKFIKDLLGKELAQQLTPAFYTVQGKAVKKHLPLCG